MTAAEKNAAAAGRRRRDLELATARLRQEQEAETYGVVSFHLQAGRIVRVRLETSETLGA